MSHSKSANGRLVKVQKAMRVLVHEFGHVVVGHVLGLGKSQVMLNLDDRTISPTIAGQTTLSDTRGQANVLHPKSLQVAVAGSISEMMYLHGAPADEDIANHFIERFASLGDRRLAREALGNRDATVDDVLMPIKEVGLIVNAYFPQIMARAAIVAERLADMDWNASYQVPDSDIAAII